jgi:hypothetical protein
MTAGLVLDPTGAPTDHTGVLNDLLGGAPLSSKRVGIRLDERWRSWQWVADEWAAQFRMRGADVTLWRAGTRVGARADSIDDGLDKFVHEIDLGIFGLGNCGGCTMETVRDAVAALRNDVPSVIICTRQFVGLARNLARMDGFGEVPIIGLPFPLETHPEEDVRKIAQEAFEDIQSVLGSRLGDA